MTYERLAMFVVCCGLAAACSSVGPDDGLGGRGGAPTGRAGSGAGVGGNVTGGPGGRVGRGGAGGVAGGAGVGGAGGGVVEGRGGSGWIFTANDLPCLKKLFADCPTEPGICRWVNLGLGGGPGTSQGHLCYPSGTTADTFSVELDCHTAPTIQLRYSGRVYRSDGSLCYTFLRTCECASDCDNPQYTFRSASGEVIATGQSGTLSCATGESCPPVGAAGNGGGATCVPAFPGFQCVEGTCP